MATVATKKASIHKAAPSIRRRNRGSTEAALLAAGLDVMSARGFTQATTRQIAEQAGVNEQLITRYFGGKEGLLIAIMRSYRQSEPERERAVRLEPADTVQEEIAGFLSEANFSVDRECIARLALGQALVDPAMAEAINELRSDCYTPLLRERLQVHSARGAIDPLADLDLAAEVLVHLRLGFAAYGRLLFALPADQLQQFFDYAALLFARGLSAPSASAIRIHAPRPLARSTTSRSSKSSKD